MKQSNFSSSRRDSCCWLIKATALGLYLAVSSVASAQEKSYSFLPLGYQNTACSRWVRVTDPKTQSVAFDGSIDGDGTVTGEFWFEHQTRWTRYAKSNGTSYQLTLTNPEPGPYQLCWSHRTPGPEQVTGTLTAKVGDVLKTHTDPGTCPATNERVVVILDQCASGAGGSSSGYGCTLADRVELALADHLLKPQEALKEFRDLLWEEGDLTGDVGDVVTELDDALADLDDVLKNKEVSTKEVDEAVTGVAATLADLDEAIQQKRLGAETEEITLGKYWQWFKEAWYESHIDERVKRAEKVLDATDSEATTYLWMLGDEVGVTSVTEAIGGWGVDEERDLTGFERVKRGAYGLGMSLLNYVGLRGSLTPKASLGGGTGTIDDVVRAGADDAVAAARKTDELVLSNVDEAASHEKSIKQLKTGVDAVLNARMKQNPTRKITRSFHDSAELGVLEEGNQITLLTHGRNLRETPHTMHVIDEKLLKFIEANKNKYEQLYAEFIACKSQHFIEKITDKFPGLEMIGYLDDIKILAKGKKGIPTVAEGSAAGREADAYFNIP